jgi:hypothetical protein
MRAAVARARCRMRAAVARVRRPKRAAAAASKRGRSGLGLAVVFAASCAPVPPSAWVHPTPAEWSQALAALQQLRASVPRSPYVATVTTTLRDARSGRTVDGRGAVAVAPGQAVRMILVGGAGATLLDAWVTRERWRIAVPPLEIVKRGGAESPAGLPVGFLRWWFVSPLEGVSFAGATAPDGERWLLRDGDAVVDLRLARCARGTRVTATRRVRGHGERIDECSPSSSPLGATAGDDVSYTDETSGLRVTVAVESVGSTAPDPAAFLDPDREGGGT